MPGIRQVREVDPGYHRENSRYGYHTHKPDTGRWQNPDGEELPFWKQEQKEEKSRKPVVGFIVLLLVVVAVVAGGLVYSLSKVRMRANELNMPEGGASQPTYYLNTYRMKFHKPDCPSVEQMMDENRQAFYGTREEAIGKGYSPCQNCKP